MTILIIRREFAAFSLAKVTGTYTLNSNKAVPAHELIITGR